MGADWVRKILFLKDIQTDLISDATALRSFASLIYHSAGVQ